MADQLDTPAVITKRHTHAWRADLLWGVGTGAVCALSYTAYVLFFTVVRRNSYWARYHTTSWRIIAGYWSAGIIAGVALGILRPLLSRRWGWAIGGAIAGSVAYSAIMITTQMAVGWIFFVMMAGIGAFGGLGLGLVFYDDTYGTPISTMREVRRIAVIVTIGVTVGALIWILCYPPVCLLGGRYCR
jgi:hypothetical protein